MNVKYRLFDYYPIYKEEIILIDANYVLNPYLCLKCLIRLSYGKNLSDRYTEL